MSQLFKKINDTLEGSIKQEASIVDKIIFSSNNDGDLECLVVVKECIAINGEIDNDIPAKGHNNLYVLVKNEAFKTALSNVITQIMQDYKHVIGKQPSESSMVD